MKRFIAETVAVAAIAAGAGAAGVAVHEARQPSHAEVVPIDPNVLEDSARNAIAARFAGGCTIKRVVDIGQKPPRGVPGAGDRSRTTLAVTLGLQDTPAAERALDKYEHDDAVGWDALNGDADIVHTDKQGKPYLWPVTGTKEGKIREPNAEDESVLTLYPATNHPENTTAVVKVGTEVNNSDARTGNYLVSTGTFNCGSIVLKNVDGKVQWTQSPDKFPGLQDGVTTRVH